MNTDVPDHPQVTVTYVLSRPARLGLESFARVTGTHPDLFVGW